MKFLNAKSCDLRSKTLMALFSPRAVVGLGIDFLRQTLRPLECQSFLASSFFFQRAIISLEEIIQVKNTSHKRYFRRCHREYAVHMYRHIKSSHHLLIAASASARHVLDRSLLLHKMLVESAMTCSGG